MSKRPSQKCEQYIYTILRDNLKVPFGADGPESTQGVTTGQQTIRAGLLGAGSSSVGSDCWRQPLSILRY